MTPPPHLSLRPQVLRQLQQGLAKCYSVAFEKSGAVSDAKITPHTLNFVKKLVSTFGVGLENVSNVSTMFSSAASESLARRAQATAQDPVFQKMKGQFATGRSLFTALLSLLQSAFSMAFDTVRDGCVCSHSRWVAGSIPPSFHLQLASDSHRFAFFPVFCNTIMGRLIRR